MMRPEFDERDATILAERASLLDEIEGPRCGDFVIFADGVTRRISHLWPDGPQTSDHGSYYLGDGYVSMSGSLYSAVPFDTLTLTDDVRTGSVWFFHHDWAHAHNGVDAVVPFRVYRCSLDAPTS